jgi:hypothetical protein
MAIVPNENIDTDENSEQETAPAIETKPSALSAPPVGADDDSEDMDFNFEEESEEEVKKLETRKAQSKNALASLNHDDLFAAFNPDDEEDAEEDAFNDPSISHLDEPPLLGGRGRETSLFGNRASTPVGRATSPRLYSQAAQFPTCSQLRVWKWENGVPVGLGAIDSMATEEDLVQQFFEAMPRRGEGRCQYKMRPIDINGNEMGQEINIIISEHHAALQRKRRILEEEKHGMFGSLHQQDPVFEAPTADPGSQLAGEMSRIFEKMLETSEYRSRALEDALEAERDRMRDQEQERARERVDLATNAAQGVQVLTQRMMEDESRRAERAMKMQGDQSQMMVNTLTSIFAQQNTMMQSSMEAARRNDEFRLEQERQRAERERREAEDRRIRERDEIESRRRQEKEEAERKILLEREYLDKKLLREESELKARLERERRDYEIKLQREREEREARDRRDREDREARERWFAEERARRESKEREDARAREAERQRQHDRMMKELEQQQTKDREHAERMMILSRQELSNKAMGGIGELIPKASGFLREMGMEPAEVVQRILGGGRGDEEERPSVWAETLPKLLGAGADIAKAALGGSGGVPNAAMPPVQALPQYQQYPDIEIPELTRDMYKQAVPRYQEAPQPQEPIITPAPPQEGAIPQAAPQMPIMDTAKLASDAGLTMHQQKQGRVGMRKLVAKLSGTIEESWEGSITEALMTNLDIYHYIQSVSLVLACAEAGADPMFTDRIIAALKQSSLVPDDLNYGI